MSERSILVHLIGAILAVSAIIHSYEGYTSFLLLLPFILISVSVELKEDKYSMMILAGASLILPYFFDQNYMTDYFSIAIFITTFIAPFIIYWIVILSTTINLNSKGLLLSASYFGLSISLFYSIIFLLNISDFILAEENGGPQALVLIGSILLAMIPFHIWLSFKD